MYYAEQKANYIAFHQFMANRGNELKAQIFNQALENWKFNSRALQALGKPTPEKPEVPTFEAVDLERCEAAFDRWYNGGEQVKDFYLFTPMPIAANAFDLAPPAVPEPNDPVAGPDGDIPGQYLVSAGDTHPVNAIIIHPQYGRLMKWGKATPFGAPAVRWIALR
jgi:hypothetical protein